MRIARMAVLAAMISVQALSAKAEERSEQFFRQLDMNGDGYVELEEFAMQKGAILYALDKNRSLKIEQAETKLDSQKFRQYAGEDNVIDGLELFELPDAQFTAFDHDRDQKISGAEFHGQVAMLRTGPQAAEGQ